MGSNEQHPPPPSSAVALPSLDEMERRLTTPRGILMHRMLCLGMSIPSSSDDDHDGDGDDGDDGDAGRSGCRARDDDHRQARDNEEQEEYDDDEVVDASDDDDDDVDVDGAKLGGVTGGLPTILLSLLEVAFESWSGLHETTIASSSLPSQQLRHDSPPISSTTKAMRLSDTNEYSILMRTLVLLSNAARSDPTLGEEIALGRGRRGMTLATVRSLLIGRVGELLDALVVGDDDDEGEDDDDADALADLQDAVFGIYPPSSSMPSSSSSSLLQASSPCMPLADEELRRRLPLVYDLTMPASHRRRRRGGGDGEAHRPRRDHPRPRQRMRRGRSSTSTKTTTTTTTTTTTSMEIYIGQVVTRRQTEQADVGFVMWPSAIALSRYLVANPHRIVGGGGGSATGSPPSVILELGAGCGLVGIVAARMILAHRRRGEKTCDDDDGDDGDEEGEIRRRNGERRRDLAAAIVVITDFNDIVLENIARNVELNGVSSVARTSRLDFYEQSGDCRSGRWVAGGGTTGAGGGADGGGGGVSSGDDGRGRPPADVVLAADVICRPEDAVAASRTIYDALRPGGVALVVLGNAEHRYGVEIFPGECEMRGLKVTSTDVADMMLHDGGRGLPPGGGDSMMETAAGYVDGMRMTFFEITKMM